MNTDVQQPWTKELLVRNSLRSLGTKHRRGLASALLFGRVHIPVQWLTEGQQVFLALGKSSMLDAETRAAGLELVPLVVQLCDGLIPRLIDDYLRRQALLSALDPGEREHLRRGGPVPVREAIFRACASWPPADPDRLEPAARLAVDQALCDVLARRRARRRPGSAGAASAGGPWRTAATTKKAVAGDDGPVPVLRQEQGPADDRDLTDRHTTRATSGENVLKRYISYGWHQVLWGLVKASVWTAVSLAGAAVLSVLYTLIFLALRHYAPDLTVKQAMVIAGAAVGTALGGTGLGLAGQALKARRDRRGQPGGEPPA